MIEYGVADCMADLRRDKFKAVAVQSRVGTHNVWEWGLHDVEQAQFRKMLKDGRLVVHQIKEPECYVLVAKLARPE